MMSFDVEWFWIKDKDNDVQVDIEEIKLPDPISWLSSIEELIIFS